MDELRSFLDALKRTPEAAIELSDDTRVRYHQGRVPRLLRWLVRHPALIAALAADAQRLAEQPAEVPA